MRIPITVIALMFVSACASQIMQGYVGKPMQSAMVDYGPPANAFDMGDGRRAFQWVMNQTYVAPTNVTNTGAAVPIGTSVWWTQNTMISGGQAINSRCVYTLYARWSDSANVWLIESFEKPRLSCE